MSFLFDTPDPPNPFLTAGAQTGSNVATGVANTVLGNVNQQTPQGNLNYNNTGTFQWTDPVSFQTYSIPQFTAQQTLTPTGQNTFDQSQQAQFNLASLGNEQAWRLREQFRTPLSSQIAGAPDFGDPNALLNAPQAQTAFGSAGAPTAGFGDAGTIGTTFGTAPDVRSQFGGAPGVQTQFGGAPGVQTQFGGAGDITKTYGDFASERNRIEAGLMERLNPSLAIERQKYEQQLADQGIRYGSPAYENAMRNYSMQANDARLGVIGQAGSEQQRMADMAAQRAGFQNAAQMQEYQQQLGRGTFANQAQAQIYGQELGRGEFANRAQQQIYGQELGRGEFENKAQQQAYEQAQGRGEFANEAQRQQYEQMFGRGQFFNAAQQQQFAQEAQRAAFANAGLAQNFQQDVTGFNAVNAQRQQYLDEQFALRNQPINEISALLSGSQVQQPNFLNTNSGTIANTDVAGILNSNFNNQMAVSNQQAALANTVIGGLFGFGGGLAKGGAFKS